MQANGSYSCQSYTVTCGCYTEEFSLDCNITDVQAYFNVSGGGLLLNGMGPVVRRVYDGCAYELRGRCSIQVAPCGFGLLPRHPETLPGG